MPESVSNHVARSALAARIYAALGDERRLSLLAELRAGERHVGDLTQATDQPQPTVSTQLATLRDAWLLQPHRQGRRVYYAATHPAVWGVLEAGERLTAALQAPLTPSCSRPCCANL